IVEIHPTSPLWRVITRRLGSNPARRTKARARLDSPPPLGIRQNVPCVVHVNDAVVRSRFRYGL
ncbi:MAG: hypothetical protein ACRERE_20080, partial [Candidatus Entotheonellia bacterium]